MIQIKTIAITLMTLAAVAVPASAASTSAADHRDNNNRVGISYGVNLNLGNMSIRAITSPIRNFKNSRPTRVYIALERDRRHNDYYLGRFEDSVRRGFEHSAHGNFDIVRSPSYADIVIRLDRREWASSYQRYVSAAKHGRYNQRYDMRSKMIDTVALRALSRAYDMRRRYSHNVRYDDKRDYHRSDRYDDGRRYIGNVRYRH